MNCPWANFPFVGGGGLTPLHNPPASTPHPARACQLGPQVGLRPCTGQPLPRAPHTLCVGPKFAIGARFHPGLGKGLNLRRWKVPPLVQSYGRFGLKLLSHTSKLSAPKAFCVQPTTLRRFPFHHSTRKAMAITTWAVAMLTLHMYFV